MPNRPCYIQLSENVRILMMYSWDGCSNISISFRTDLYSASVPDRCGRADCLSQCGRPSFLFHRPGKCKSGTNNPGGYLELFMAGRCRICYNKIGDNFDRLYVLTSFDFAAYVPFNKCILSDRTTMAGRIHRSFWELREN